MTRRFLGFGTLVLLLVLLPALSACGSRTESENGEQPALTYAPGRLKLIVAEDGVYRVTADELAGSGFEPEDGLTYDTVRLSSGPDAVPFLVAEDALIFYGQAADDRYVAERPYLLEIGQAGLAMKEAELPEGDGPQLDEIKQTIHLEENNIYVSEARESEDSDVWFWSKLPQQSLFETEFTLPAVNEGPAALRFNAWGFTHNPQVENDHDLEILVNDVSAGTVAWDGQTYHTGEIALPENALRPGVNKITLDNRAEGASFLDIIQVNWLELDYPAPPAATDDRLDFSANSGGLIIEGLSGSPVVLDINDPGQPVRLDGWQYDSGQLSLAAADGIHIATTGPRGFLTPRLEGVLESSLLDEEQQADLIIITSDLLAPALAPLVSAREAEGLSVAVVPVNEIYDTFGYGAPTPESIRDFLAYAYDNWQSPQPRYLLLVGDATSDFQGNLGETPQNLVPSLIVPVQFSGETVSDSRLADIDNDMRPDLAVGRWPVRTSQEVTDLVERTLAYEEGPASDRAIFATDGSETTFSQIAGRLIDDGKLPRDLVEQRDGPTAEEIGELWQEGAWLATYVGHGSIDRWGKEDMFNLEELDKLAGESAPIVLQLTCLTGLFSHPEQVSLAEAMLLHPGGPVQIVAASSLTFSSHQEPFAVELLQQLQDSENQRIGDAFLGAKHILDIENSDGLREISDTFALFGDPSAAISRP